MAEDDSDNLREQKGLVGESDEFPMHMKMHVTTFGVFPTVIWLIVQGLVC